MSNKITLDYVKNYVNEISNGQCEVLSEEYISYSTPLNIRCSCGEIFQKDFDHLKRKRKSPLKCKKCTKNDQAKDYSFSLEEVKEYISSTGCEYISGEYKNNKSILTIKCRCGQSFHKPFIKFKSGQDRCPDCGNEITRNAVIKYSADYVQEVVFKERGYTIDKDLYQVSYKPVPCTCSKGHKFSLRFDWYLRGQSGCKECRVAHQTGENTSNWKGGQNEVIDAFRKAIADWKQQVVRAYGFKCAISNEWTRELVIHHLKSFNTIILEASKNLGIPVLRKSGDYDNYDDYLKLKDEVVRLHEVSNGIVIQRKYHNEFHDLYGRGDNTESQFNDYLIKYHNITLNDIRKYA